MIEIKQSESTQGFVAPVFFERTERLKSSVIDCSIEELRDYVFHQMSMLERIQMICENTNRELEDFLGYHENLGTPWSGKIN